MANVGFKCLHPLNAPLRFFSCECSQHVCLQSVIAIQIQTQITHGDLSSFFLHLYFQIWIFFLNLSKSFIYSMETNKVSFTSKGKMALGAISNHVLGGENLAILANS